MSGRPPADLLGKIVQQRQRTVPQGHPVPLPSPGGRLTPQDNRFLAAVSRLSPAAVIAEVKLGSPKLGSLVGRFDPERQAELYAANGAAALSVVVEPDFFFGSYGLLTRAVKASGLPAIAKDFVVDPTQLYWARDAGASAILLVAALYAAPELLSYAEQARALGLVALIEVHDRDDLAKLAGSEWELVGVNNRDLRTFEVDLQHSIDLVPELPTGALRIAESGIRSRAEIALLSRAGFDGYLIGESLVLADDPARKLRELLA